MVVLLTVIIAVICILLMVVVLVQNPKGGGLDASFGGKGAQQVLGASRSTDFMEKLTWYLFAALIVLCIVVSVVIS
jgi:preprotein translocase subunit SecG